MKGWLLALVVAAACSATESKSDELYDRDALGAVTFSLSEGTPQARVHFMRGMLALHSFWYDEATRQFEAAIAADSNMNMAYWGAAMSMCKLLWGDDDVAAALKMLRRMPDPDRLPEREQAWVLATIALLTDTDVRTSRKRFVQAMTEINRTFPDDESATFLAVALLASTRPDDPDHYAVRMHAAALALQVLQHNPKHPGAAHYLIHAYDVPELAPLALPFAQAYVAIAPAAFHARHMPAHIFAQLGLWHLAISSCQAAWDASVSAAKREKLSPDHHDFHSLTWLVEMNFELGHRRAADAAMTEFADAVRGGLGHQARAAYASEVASYMARTGEWSRIDELLAPLAAAAVGSPGGATRGGGGPSHCAPTQVASPPALLEELAILGARVRAAAMRRDLADTQRLLTAIDLVNQQLRPFLQSMQSASVLAQRDAAHGRRRATLLARAAGDDRALLEALRATLADVDAISAGETNPSGFLVHEEIGDTLMRLDQPKQAAVEYALALRTHPRRATSLLGAARAAARADEPKLSRTRYQELLELWKDADAGTDGLQEARAAVQ